MAEIKSAAEAADELATEHSPQFEFVRDGVGVKHDWETGPDKVRKAVGEALNARHVAFLLGAGCSSLRLDDKECGIATMQPLAETFCVTNAAPAIPIADDPNQAWRLTDPERTCLAEMGISLTDPEYTRNLERLMEALHSLHFVLCRSVVHPHDAQAELVASIISKVKQFLWSRCTDGAFEHGDGSVLALYERFYRGLVFRERSLPRPWVFTTNYDLFNERAMDRLGLPYANGFSGVIERRFNPSTFRYALAEQLDLSQKKWSAVDGFVYLCKLHGSVSWTEDGHGLFPIREQWPAADSDKVMIYPTPAKQNSSLGSPYADLFREFQHRIVREQSVLVTAGYAFGDEHINNIIYQALTVPTFRLIIFANPGADGEIAKLRALGDPRIWIVGGDGPTPEAPAHYFTQVVDHFMPQRPAERIEAAVKKVLEAFGADDAGVGEIAG
jgi:hypothetical protein